MVYYFSTPATKGTAISWGMMAVTTLQYNIFTGWININLHYFQTWENIHPNSLLAKASKKTLAPRSRPKPVSNFINSKQNGQEGTMSLHNKNIRKAVTEK